MRYAAVFVCIVFCALTAEAQYHSLHGTVRAQRNLNPLAGVRVWAEGRLDTAISNSAGAYSLSLLNGDYQVHFERTAYCTYQREVLIIGSDVALAVELDDPDFYCNVTSITTFAYPGQDSHETFFLSNEGGLCPLQFTISDTSNWLSTDPDTGAVAENGTQTIMVTFHGDLVPPGHDVVGVLRIDHNGANSPYFIPVMFAVFLEADDLTELAPSSYSLLAYPNPFNPVTTISFTLAGAAKTELRVFDISGRCVNTLVDATLAAGEHQMTFDGAGLPSGIYFAKLEAGGVQRTQKLVLLK